MNVVLHPRYLNVISLCTGGGGLDLGVELAVPGARTICMVEREAFAVAHLVAAMQQDLLAQCPVWSDVRTFPGRSFRGKVDGVIGGIPCQPHSLAGRRLGEDDERDLWSAARRVIVQTGAWFVVIENVEGMLTSGGAKRVVGDLQRLGFTVEIGLFSASEAGASHQRNRVFIVAVADRTGVGFGRRPGFEPGQPTEHGKPEPGHDGCELAHAECDRRRQGAENLFEGQSISSVSGVELANTNGARLALGLRPAVEPTVVRHEGPDASAGGDGMDNVVCGRRRDTVASTHSKVADAHRIGPEAGRPSRLDTGCEGGRALVEPTSGDLDDAEGRAGFVHPRQWRPDKGEIDARGAGDLGLFPPGPTEWARWRRVLEAAPQLEPAIRRVADGLASWLHEARIEQLRLLGNGVVPLEAAYAIRTLSTRMARRGSAGATRLVLMMEQIE